MTIVNGIHLFSNSEIQTYKDCPRKWWLAWYRGLVLKRVSPLGARATGTRVHVALAGLYVPEGETPANPLVTLQNVQQEDLGALATQTYDVESGDEAEYQAQQDTSELLKAFDLERAMIEGYVGWLEETGADAHLEVIASETYVEVEFNEWIFGVPVKLIGKIDARVRNRVTGRRRFIDHKTVGTLQDPVLGLNQQMLHYHVIESLLTPLGDKDTCDGALYNMLRKVKRTRASKPPYFARVPIDHNKFELKNYKLQLTRVIEEILAVRNRLDRLDERTIQHQRIVPSRPSRDCSWKCDFFKICRMFDDGSRVEQAIEEYYEVRDPLSYYGGQEKVSD